MIGGYFYREKEDAADARLRAAVSGFGRIGAFDRGYFFYSNPFHSDVKPSASSEDLIALSEDLLVTRDPEGPYRAAGLDDGFLDAFRSKGPAVFDSIHSDFRIAVASRQGSRPSLCLASHRAGSGRIYYRKLKAGILFCSDLRFLLTVVPFDVSRKAFYALLKYGCIPEPLTIAEDISAVPAAHFMTYDPDTGRESIEPYFKYAFTADAPDALFNEEASLRSLKGILSGTARLLGDFRPAMLLSGGIDSSLYGCYLHQEKPGTFQGFYCSFGQYDPEYRHALAVADKTGVKLQVAIMAKKDAMQALDDVVRLTDHPFSDFSSLPITFLLNHVKERQGGNATIIECNGADDCFGFAALTFGQKFRAKHSLPAFLKKAVALALMPSSCWKWESSEGFLARVAAMADVHERSCLNYFLVQAPVNYLRMETGPGWDESIQEMIETTAANCGQDYSRLSYEAKTTIRQLFFVNSSRWAAKALSVGESLGQRVVYPYIWRDVLIEQGKLPWSAKVHGGIVKWPLKRLLEEHMPVDFIYRKKSGFVPPFVHWLTDPEFNDKVGGIIAGPSTIVSEIIPARILREFLADARGGKKLRSPILATLWGSLFAESWIREHKSQSSSSDPVSGSKS